MKLSEFYKKLRNGPKDKVSTKYNLIRIMYDKKIFCPLTYVNYITNGDYYPDYRAGVAAIDLKMKKLATRIIRAADNIVEKKYEKIDKPIRRQLIKSLKGK